MTIVKAITIAMDGLKFDGVAMIKNRWKKTTNLHNPAAWLRIPSRILRNSGEFPISDPFLTQFLPIPFSVPIGIVVPAKY